MKKITIARITVSTFVLCAAVSQNSSAQDFIKGGEETFTLGLGGILNQFGTSVRLDGQTSKGNDIDLENSGLKKSVTSFQGAATWRFLPNHRIDLLYFEADRSASRTTDREISIGGSVIPINFSLTTEAKDQFWLGGYRYSFVKSPAWEVAGVLGVFAGHFSYDFNATGIRQGQPSTIRTNAATTVPLPIIGVSADWYIDPRWKVSGSVSGIKANIGDYDGSVIVAQVGTEYMITRNWGLGLAYMYSDIDVDVTKSSFNGNLGWTMNSVRGYVQLKF